MQWADGTSYDGDWVKNAIEGKVIISVEFPG